MRFRIPQQSRPYKCIIAESLIKVLLKLCCENDRLCKKTGLSVYRVPALQNCIAIPMQMAIPLRNAHRLRQSLDRRPGHRRPDRRAQGCGMRTDLPGESLRRALRPGPNCIA